MTMRSFVFVLLAVAGYCHARPSFDAIAKPATWFDSFIVGGEEATPGEFPWQLSQQRLQGTSTWSHSCGASLLSARYALSAAHCVEGASPTSLRVIAGLHDRNDPNGKPVLLSSYKIHADYGSGEGTYPNDIAILSLAEDIIANGGTIQYATLPDDNSQNFAGRTCVISGWGRTSSASTLPQYLQKVDIGIITTDLCNQLLAPVTGALATDSMICLYDINKNTTGSCNGDSGGPLNCNYPNPDSNTRVVAGVTSWGISSSGACRQDFPSVYTRTSAYLDWIKENAPSPADIPVAPKKHLLG